MFVDSLRRVLANESRGPLRLTQTQAPGAEPVLLADVKTHLRIEATLTADDDYINTLIMAARAYLEEVTGRALITQQWRYTFDQWYRWQIEIPRAAPLQSIESIQYYDTENVLQTLDSSVYQVDTDAEPGNVRPTFGNVWPSTYFRMGAIQINFIAGYGDAGTSVPPPLLHAIRFLVGHWYENRASVEVNAGPLSMLEVPDTFKALIRPYEARLLT